MQLQYIDFLCPSHLNLFLYLIIPSVSSSFNLFNWFIHQFILYQIPTFSFLFQLSYTRELYAFCNLFLHDYFILGCLPTCNFTLDQLFIGCIPALCRTCTYRCPERNSYPYALTWRLASTRFRHTLLAQFRLWSISLASATCRFSQSSKSHDRSRPFFLVACPGSSWHVIATCFGHWLSSSQFLWKNLLKVINIKVLHLITNQALQKGQSEPDVRTNPISYHLGTHNKIMYFSLQLLVSSILKYIFEMLVWDYIIIIYNSFED